ncbi:hypothetical protein [uncultured Corynebacterium sp.]|nr:hypothetical protein [uncultured Corynebacterium sp.]
MLDAILQNIHHFCDAFKPAVEWIPQAIHNVPAPSDARAPQGK